MRGFDLQPGQPGQPKGWPCQPGQAAGLWREPDRPRPAEKAGLSGLYGLYGVSGARTVYRRRHIYIFRA